MSHVFAFFTETAATEKRRSDGDIRSDYTSFRMSKKKKTPDV